MSGMLLALFAQAAASSVGNHYIPVDKLPWHREAPNIPAELAPLWGDRSKGEAGTYLRVPGGWEAPLHDHTADYWALVIQGEWTHWVPSTGEGKGIRLTPGAHWTQIKDQPHKDKCLSPTPCIIFLFNRDPYETKFVPEGATTKK
jgi:Domain of unknown function (DUF4437)